MILLVAFRRDGVVRLSVYVAGTLKYATSTGPLPGRPYSIAHAMRDGWQWLVDNWAGFPVVGNA